MTLTAGFPLPCGLHQGKPKPDERARSFRVVTTIAMACYQCESYQNGADVMCVARLQADS